MRTRLKLFREWGITFSKPYEIAEQSARQVQYVDRHELDKEISRRHAACEETPKEIETVPAASGGVPDMLAPAINIDPFEQKQESARG